jgi:hypothetical protein
MISITSSFFKYSPKLLDITFLSNLWKEFIEIQKVHNKINITCSKLEVLSKLEKTLYEVTAEVRLTASVVISSGLESRAIKLVGVLKGQTS